MTSRDYTDPPSLEWLSYHTPHSAIGERVITCDSCVLPSSLSHFRCRIRYPERKFKICYIFVASLCSIMKEQSMEEVEQGGVELWPSLTKLRDPVLLSSRWS